MRLYTTDRPFRLRTSAKSSLWTSISDMSLLTQVYNALFRRTSTFALTIITGAFFFERFLDEGGDFVFNRMNQGKLWHQIKHKYAEQGEEEDDE